MKDLAATAATLLSRVYENDPTMDTWIYSIYSHEVFALFNNLDKSCCKLCLFWAKISRKLRIYYP